MNAFKEPAIGIDASFLGAAGGIGTSTWGLLQALARMASDRKICLFSNRLPESVAQYGSYLERERKRLPDVPDCWETVQSEAFNRFWWCNLTLPPLLRKQKVQLYHALDSVSIPVWQKPCPLVLNVNDLFPLTHPQFSRWRDAAAATFFLPRAIRATDRIIAISQYTADQIEERYPPYRNKVRVVHLGVDRDYFCPVEDRSVVLEAIRSKWHITTSNFLFAVMTLNPRRNLERLLLAFQQSIKSLGVDEIALVIAGCRGWKDHAIFQTVQRLGLESQVQFLGFVDDGDLPALYQSALAAVVPSLAEGFGLPVLEAMACGTPVVCSSTTALGEIASDAACSIDPLDADSMANGLCRVIGGEGYREELAAKGLQRAALFTWEETARKTLDVYCELLDDV